jgi:hypothetical protein
VTHYQRSSWVDKTARHICSTDLPHSSVQYGRGTSALQNLEQLAREARLGFRTKSGNLVAGSSESQKSTPPHQCSELCRTPESLCLFHPAHAQRQGWLTEVAASDGALSSMTLTALVASGALPRRQACHRAGALTKPSLRQLGFHCILYGEVTTTRFSSRFPQ